VCAATEFFVRLAVCMLVTARGFKSLIGRGMKSYVILGALVVQNDVVGLMACVCILTARVFFFKFIYSLQLYTK